MTEETVVAVYDTAAHAESAVQGLKAAGIPATDISVHAGSARAEGTTTAPVREEGFWASLFGGEPDHDTSVYDRSIESGSTVVSVRTSDAQITRVSEILEQYHPIDIDERAASYGMAQTTTTTREPLATPSASTASTKVGVDGGENLQLSEENLAIGKRVINRGGTRIRRFVVETPVEQQVTLHDEKVTLERRPITDGRPVGDSFTEKTVEMTESAEEAVVSKTARVYEEVGLKKNVADRVETVRDTVRKEEVKVEQIPGGTTTTTTQVNDAPLNPRAPKI